MHALFFEVRPKPGHLKHYFEHVDRLRPVLARHPGLVFLDRYGALDDADVLLSHQLWQDEAAIIGWRADPEHRRSQTAGRKVHFQDYRIRVCERVRHWSADGAAETGHHGADPSPASHLIAAYGAAPLMHPGCQAFESVNHKGQFVTLGSAAGADAAGALFDALAQGQGVTSAAAYAVLRDYGQFDRAQAPVHSAPA
ncbi:MAG: antibiotic biosynthesis monooxygenase [Rhodobacteraceae bacterium]|nr:antibiotic biosynthesis monooxygenase [Paracoccaceae bacterium]